MCVNVLVSLHLIVCLHMFVDRATTDAAKRTRRDATSSARSNATRWNATWWYAATPRRNDAPAWWNATTTGQYAQPWTTASTRRTSRTNGRTATASWTSNEGSSTPRILRSCRWVSDTGMKWMREMRLYCVELKFSCASVKLVSAWNSQWVLTDSIDITSWDVVQKPSVWGKLQCHWKKDIMSCSDLMWWFWQQAWDVAGKTFSFGHLLPPGVVADKWPFKQ